MNKYLYLLWDHDEWGPEYLVATFDRDKIKPLVIDYLLANQYMEAELEYEEPMICLENMLARNDDELITENKGKHGIQYGWGGLHLQITKIV